MCIHFKNVTIFSTVVQFCEPLDNPENGMVTLTSTLENSIAVYSCENGYQLVGEGSRTCERNSSTIPGVWSGNEPMCMGMLYLYNLTTCIIIHLCIA